MRNLTEYDVLQLKALLHRIHDNHSPIVPSMGLFVMFSHHLRIGCGIDLFSDFFVREFHHLEQLLDILVRNTVILYRSRCEIAENTPKSARKSSKTWILTKTLLKTLYFQQYFSKSVSSPSALRGLFEKQDNSGLLLKP